MLFSSLLEVDRSLWDRNSLIVHVDLEYHNFDRPAAAWLDPERAFRLQQPVVDATLSILSDFGVVPLTLLSGRGYHLVWKIRRNSNAFKRLSRLGFVPSCLQHRYAQPCSPAGSPVDDDLGRAFAGLGLLMEFLWHRVRATPETSGTPPVQPAAIEVGPGVLGREIISFDLSEYGDPLHTRQIRVPFSAYLKPRKFQWLLGKERVRNLLPIFEVPLSGMTLRQALAVARDTDQAQELSRHVSVRIPEASAEMDSFLDTYQTSELAEFHSRVYCQLGERRGAEGAIPIPEIPACAQWILENPNDWLLKPAALQHLVRVFMALGWSPASIFPLISGIYHKDYSWGETWTRLDPENRAIFYTRLFGGMIATGVDKLIDFNCVSHQEKGYCMIPDRHANLMNYRNLLFSRCFNE